MTARMLAPVRFAYRDLWEAKPLDRVPFPEAGFPELPGGLDLSEPWVYEADLLYAVAGGKVATIAIRNGLPAPPYFLPPLEGSTYEVFLDAWLTPGAALHSNGAAWRHPGPPPRKEMGRLVPGVGLPTYDDAATRVTYQVVPIPCTRFAWWRRLEVLVEALAAMYDRFSPLRRSMLEALGWADYTNRLLTATWASSPTRAADPEFRDALDAIRRSAAGLLLAVEGRGKPSGTPFWKPFLQQYANVGALLNDVVLSPELHTAIDAHHSSLPDEARSSVVTALALVELVPPGRGRGRDGPATVSPRYGQEILARAFEPWILERAVESAPWADLHRAAVAKRTSEPGPWSLLKAAGRFSLGLLGPAVRRTTTNLGELLLRLPNALDGLATLFDAIRDAEAARWARSLTGLLRASERTALTRLEGLAGGVTEASTSIEGVAEALRLGPARELELLVESLAAWKPARGMLSDSALLRAREGIPLWSRPLEDVDIRPAWVRRAPSVGAGVYVLSALDIVWQGVYFWSAVSATNFRDSIDVAKLVGVDVLTIAGNVLGAAGGVVAMAATVRGLERFGVGLAATGSLLGVAGSAADLGFFLYDYIFEIRPEIRDEGTGLRDKDAFHVEKWCVLSLVGKAAGTVGSVLSMTPLAPLGALLSGSGAFLDSFSRVMAARIAGGARVASAYLEAQSRLQAAMDVTRIHAIELGVSVPSDRGDDLALARLRAYDGFRPLDPEHLRRFLLDSEATMPGPPPSGEAR